MDTIIGAVIGTLGVALITGVLAFARERLNKADEAMKICREDIQWYRDKLFPVVEKQQGVLEALQKRAEVLETQGDRRQETLEALATQVEGLREDWK